MNNTAIRYHYWIRILGVAIMLLLISFSEYHKHIEILMFMIIFFVMYNTIIKLKFGTNKSNKIHVFNLFFDVTILSVAVAVRGGLRSDFYLGYFMILGYVLLIRDRNLLFKLSCWIVINYTIFTFFFSEDSIFSFGRLFIRLTLLIGTALLLQNYSKMLVESETLREKAVNMAMFDSLTGAYNRRILEYIDELFFEENSLLYFVLIDVDNFKIFNDMYGHQRGDEVLIAITNEIQKVIEDNSICVRYGGEEFLVIIQAKEYNFVYNKIQKIQQNVSHNTFDWFEKKMVITFTAGISYKEEDEEIIKTIEKADRALYNGKHNGKNCIVQADEQFS